MKKVFIITLSVLLLFSLPLTVFASYDYSGGERASLLNDFSDIIDDFKESELLSELEEISTANKCEVAVLTVSATNGKDITAFADDYYDGFGFGYGENDDGIMLVVAMDIREFAITTHGRATEIFTDHNIRLLEDAFTSFLSSEEYYYAFNAFINKCEDIFNDYNNYILNSQHGHIDSNDFYSGYESDNNTVTISGNTSDIFSIKWIATALIIGIVIGFIYVSHLKSQLKSVRRKAAASDYVVPGSFQLTQQRDIFMYADVKKTPKPKANNSSGGRSGSSFGGSSSTHKSSSGRTHGGSRGRF